MTIAHISGQQQRPPEAPRAGNLGEVPWNPWYPAMTQRALRAIQAKGDPLAELRMVMQGGWSKRTEIASQARRSAGELRRLLQNADQKLDEATSPAELFRQILAEDGRKAGQGWDVADQTVLALAALHQAQVDMKVRLAAEIRPALQDLLRGLEFPKGFDSPRGFNPDAVRQRLAGML